MNPLHLSASKLPKPHTKARANILLTTSLVKRELNARLECIHKALSIKHSKFLSNLEKDLVKEYKHTFKLEQDLCFMKFRTSWIVDRDRNSKFFHLSTIRHRHHNCIYGLRISDDVWDSDQLVITKLIRDYFMDLFTSSLDSSYHDSFSTLGIITSGSIDLSSLDNPSTDKEI
ncbi:hypothetical protein SLA2020_385220 [Shorea laevis]